MQNIFNYIQEKLILNKDIVKDNKSSKDTNEIIDNPLYLTNNTITFPVILEIDHKYKEKIVGYKKVKSNKNQQWLKFYNDKNEEICTMTWKEITLIFDDGKGVMLNTKYGWLGTIWR